MKRYFILLLFISTQLLAASHDHEVKDSPRDLESEIGQWYYRNYMDIHEGVYNGETERVNEKFSELKKTGNTVEVESYTSVPTVQLIIKRWKDSGKASEEDRAKIEQMLTHVVKINADEALQQKLKITDQTIELLCINGFCMVVCQLVHQINSVHDKDITAILMLSSETRTKCLRVLLNRKLLSKEQEQRIEPFLPPVEVASTSSPSILRRIWSGR